MPLSKEELDALASFETHERNYKRGAVIVEEQDNPRELFIVEQGWLHCAMLLGNGSRQIMRFLFEGDIVGLSALPFGVSAETITAVTDVTLCPFDRDRITDLFRSHPRVAALIFNLTIAERVSMSDRLASIGRTSARARVATLLCEIAVRLRQIEGVDKKDFRIPLTQEDIGDATGLTAVHVNRMLRGLVQDGIIERSGNQVRVLNEARLAEEANFTDRSKIDVSWFPDAA